MQEIQPRIFVELGTQYGYSYFAGCQSVMDNGIDTKAFAVDTWQGDHQAGFYDNDRYLDVVKVNSKYDGFSTLLKMQFNDALDNFENGTIDLLHIDGLHTYEAVKEDFQNWLPKLSKNAIVLFHDIKVFRDDFGVYKLWDELKRGFSTFEFDHEHGLGVLKFRDGKTPVDFLFDSNLSADSVDLIKYLFSAAGSNSTLEYKLKSKDEIIEKYYLDSMNFSTKLVQATQQIRELELNIKNLKQSFSWKITKPLRKINSLFQR